MDFQCIKHLPICLYFIWSREERMGGMVWNFTCWCILPTFRNDKILVTVYWFSLFWWHFDLKKQVKIVVSGHFLENAWKEWLEIWHGDVSWTAVSSTSHNNTTLNVCERNAGHNNIVAPYDVLVGSNFWYIFLTDQWFCARLQYLQCSRKQILVCCHWQLKKERNAI